MIAFDLGYGQLLVLDVSLSILLGITGNCETALCTLVNEINDYIVLHTITTRQRASYDSIANFNTDRQMSVIST